MGDAAFPHDVFLSHSAKDKVVVRPLPERLRQDGLRVWSCPPKPSGEGGFDEWVLKPGDSIPAKIEVGTFHHSAFDLLPFLSGSVARFLYTNWRPANSEKEHAKPPELRSARQRSG